MVPGATGRCVSRCFLCHSLAGATEATWGTMPPTNSLQSSAAKPQRPELGVAVNVLGPVHLNATSLL